MDLLDTQYKITGELSLWDIFRMKLQENVDDEEEMEEIRARLARVRS